MTVMYPQKYPRIPADEQEAFAMAWMIGYLGNLPDALEHAFPDEGFHFFPDFLSPDFYGAWQTGYHNGLAFFVDHQEGLDE